jgi:hypothetical protein
VAYAWQAQLSGLCVAGTVKRPMRGRRSKEAYAWQAQLSGLCVAGTVKRPMRGRRSKEAYAWQAQAHVQAASVSKASKEPSNPSKES